MGQRGNSFDMNEIVKDTQEKILDVLSDGEFHSGEDLGQKLGMSRAAVWKQLQKLEELGLELESVKGTGYRLTGGLELLQSEVIKAYFSEISTRDFPACLIYPSLESTNQLARQMADEGGCDGTVVLAERQTDGRGRRGKHWVSPFASNIYMSLIWNFETGAAALEGLSLAIGVAVRRALVSVGVKNVQLKWPNDIYINQKKLGGILLEMTGDPAGQCSVVVGVGINVSMPAQYGRSIDQQWTDIISELPIRISRNQLVAALIEEILVILQLYHQTGFAPYREEWLSADAFKGARGTLSTIKESINGEIVGVDDSGAIQLKLKDGNVKSFIGGELSLRRAQ